MKTVPFSVPTSTFVTKELGKITIYRVVRRDRNLTQLEKLASYPDIAA